jgi:hypothetical protein
MKNNRHLDKFPEIALTQAKAKIAEISASFAPYIVALTPEERRTLLKMGDKTLAFVEKAHDFAVANPSLVPPFIDMDAYDVDFTDAHGLWTLLNSISQLYENLSNTIMVSGSEAYQTSLVFYNTIKIAAAQDVPGAAAIYEELRVRFPGNKKGDTTETETITETVSEKITST